MKYGLDDIWDNLEKYIIRTSRTSRILIKGYTGYVGKTFGHFLNKIILDHYSSFLPLFDDILKKFESILNGVKIEAYTYK
ncbi:MAG: hypothetical protein ACTSO9_21780 [Candidatus Helarchaeota archaeon]